MGENIRIETLVVWTCPDCGFTCDVGHVPVNIDGYRTCKRCALMLSERENGTLQKQVLLLEKIADAAEELRIAGYLRYDRMLHKNRTPAGDAALQETLMRLHGVLETKREYDDAVAANTLEEEEAGA